MPDSKEATPETTSNRRGYRADGPFSIPQTHRCSERNPRTSAIEASFSALAENEDWLANNCDKIIHSQGIPPQDGDAEKRTARETVAEDILRCSGALVTSDGSARQVGDGIAFPNGMAVTPDNAMLIVAECYARRLTAFDIAADGRLSNRRVWADLLRPALTA